MKGIATLLIALLVFGQVAIAQTKPPLLYEPVVAALSAELSGETAKRISNTLPASPHARVDGKRNAREIRDAVSAIYGPVPLDLILEYLRALEKIKVVMKGSRMTNER